MPEGVTIISNPQSDLRIYVYAVSDGVRIDQGWWHFIDDSIFIESRDQAENLISYLQERIDDPQWNLDRDMRDLPPQTSLYSLFVGTRSENASYPAGVMIEQRVSILDEDCILVDTPERTAKLIRAIRKRVEDVVEWW